MATHYDDEAQIETLKRWWKENWKALAMGLGVGLVGVFGYEQWQRHRSTTSETASQAYEDLKKALSADKADEAAAISARLYQDYAKTPYAANAALRMAAEAVEQNRLDDALKHLQWVGANAKDEGLKQLARLHEARVLWAQNKPDEALGRLEGETGVYAVLFEELRGDIRLAKGDRAGARAAYEKALAAGGEAYAARELLQRKLDDLADVVKS